jgi:hypothetical protein
MMIAYFTVFSRPAIQMSTRELEENMDFESWNVGGVPVSPRRVMEYKDLYSDEHKRIEDADLRYPLIVCPRETSGYYIIDGMHRYAKAYADKNALVDAYVMHEELLEKFKISDSSDYANFTEPSIHQLIVLFDSRFR